MANDMHPNGSVWHKPPIYGVLEGSNQEFTVHGNLEAALKALLDYFDIPKDNKSGPIKPLTAEEKAIEDNKPIVNTLKELPPTRGQ